MRTIKFRGKSISSGNWVTGSLLYLENHDMKSYSIMTPNGFTLEVDPETVEQYIEKISKDDDEIYDGDIVELKTEVLFSLNNFTTECTVMCYSYGVVEYQAPEYRIRLIRGHPDSFYDYMGEKFSWDELSVVGNKFDTPELLEGD